MILCFHLKSGRSQSSTHFLCTPLSSDAKFTGWWLEFSIKYFKMFPLPEHCAWECAKSLQSCLTLCHPMDCNLPGSSVHGIFQARILEWVAMLSSRGSS